MRPRAQTPSITPWRPALWIACLSVLQSAVTAATVFDAFANSPVTVSIEACGIESMILERKDGSWQARDITPPITVTKIESSEQASIDPELARLRLSFTENLAQGVLTLWFARPETDGDLPRPFFAELRGAGVLVQDWDIKMRQGEGDPVTPDKNRVAVWVVKHADALEDPSFLNLVSDYIWHHSNLDDPPGSFNSTITLNQRIIELAPHNADVYSTTAWLLWSKWVTWKQDPERMPDGEDGLQRAIDLLEKGEARNQDSADYLFQAGVVLMPVARNHKPELTERVESYLRRAAEKAEAGRLAIQARRTLAAHYFRHRQLDKAEHWYRKLLEIDPGNNVATHHLEEIDTLRKGPRTEGEAEDTP